MASSQLRGVPAESDVVPSTPPELTVGLTSSTFALDPALSQQSIASTEEPASPIDPSNSFKTDSNRPASPARVIRSSLTPPPSSQLQTLNTGVSMAQGRANSQTTTHLHSPPPTTLHISGRNRPVPAEYISPSTRQINSVGVDELRSMLQSALSVISKVKSETAHYKLQYELLSMQAAEDANRANVENEMTRREVEALRQAEEARQVKREMDARTDLRYRELQQSYDALAKEHNDLSRRLKSASKLIQHQAEEIEGLQDERNMLLTRIRENRQHFHMLCSPGGVFHGALTPKTPTSTSPQQHRTTPRQTPRSATSGTRQGNQGEEAAPFAALLEALNQDNTSAPTTPTSGNRPGPRIHMSKHRTAHSLSSLPATPLLRSRGNPGLLPSIDLVPRTEPPQRFGNRIEPQTPTQKKRRKSRESTISAEDEEEGRTGHMTLESVAAAAQTYMSQGSQRSRPREGEEEIFESQASQQASEMLRRDPRESFDVESSVDSRDVTPAPAPAEKPNNKQQSRLYAPVNKLARGMEKRKFGGGANTDGLQGELLPSPTKRLRYGVEGAVGLGIQQQNRRRG